MARDGAYAGLAARLMADAGGKGTRPRRAC